MGSSPVSPSLLAEHVNELQQQCALQQWQTNAERMLREMEEARAGMSTNKAVVEHLITERTLTRVPLGRQLLLLIARSQGVSDEAHGQSKER